MDAAFEDQLVTKAVPICCIILDVVTFIDDRPKDINKKLGQSKLLQLCFREEEFLDTPASAENRFLARFHKPTFSW